LSEVDTERTLDPESGLKKSNAVSASHRDRIGTWFPALPLSPLGGGMIASARQRSQRSSAFAEAQLPTRDLAITSPATAAVANGPILPRGTSSVEPAPKNRIEEEAATPGQPVAHARFWNVPQRFTLENRRLPLAQPQSSDKLRKSHVFAGNTLRQNAAGRNIKSLPACAEAVDDGTSLWKSEENLRRIASPKRERMSKAEC
jgi:hypothetical protein